MALYVSKLLVGMSAANQEGDSLKDIKDFLNISGEDVVLWGQMICLKAMIVPITRQKSIEEVI
jgi:hypothetical protein